MHKLYFAPINCYGNHIYRHVLLNHGVDYVFSELIRMDQVDKEILNNKLDIIKEDIDKTIFQIGVSTKEEIKEGVSLLKSKFSNIKEININMGCPQSSMKKRKICGGILYDKELMKLLCEALKEECGQNNIVPSVKLRLGTNEDNIEINDYLDIIQKSGVNKVYIHARPLCYPYTKPAMYSQLKEVKQKFSKLTIVLNGDIDSYDSYKKVTSNYECEGIMIGRAAIVNPLIFDQIKNEIKVVSGDFDPLLNDPNIIRKDMCATLSKEKKDVVYEYLNLAIKHDIRSDLVKKNLNSMLKGITNSNEFVKKINVKISLIDIKKEFDLFNK